MDTIHNTTDKTNENLVEKPIENEEKFEANETEPIGNYANPEVVRQLMEMGFSKNVADKASVLNDNNLENAVEWISTHSEDPDFEKEVRVKVKEDLKLTPEEIKQKAKELQDYARKRHLEKQREVEEEQEKNRIRISIIYSNISQGT
jgi:uncharacterized UBP type Zn finger protein